MADSSQLIATISTLAGTIQLLPDKKNFVDKLKKAREKAIKRSDIIKKIAADQNNERS
jgi:hypothetical protein